MVLFVFWLVLGVGLFVILGEYTDIISMLPITSITLFQITVSFMYDDT